MFKYLILLLISACGEGTLYNKVSENGEYKNNSQISRVENYVSSLSLDCFIGDRAKFNYEYYFNRQYFKTEAEYDFKAFGNFFSAVYSDAKLDFFFYNNNSFFYKKIANGKSFKPCYDFDYSVSESIDKASATVSGVLSNVIEPLKPFMNDIEKVDIFILPMVRKIVNNSEFSYMYNNAQYVKGKRKILYYPQGAMQSRFTPFNGVKLWQIPFVSYHEYAHAIFDSQVLSKLSTHKGFSRLRSLKTKARTSLALDALNEAQADLFASIMLGEDIGLKGVGCFDYDRDPHSRHFKNGRTKSITDQNLKQFYAGKEFLKGCSQVSFSDPHVVGTVIAYGINKMFKTNNLSKNEKVKFWFNFNEEIYRLITNINNNNDLLVESFNLAVHYMQKNYSYKETDICLDLGSFFQGTIVQKSCN